MKTPNRPALELRCRAKPSRWLKAWIVEAQGFACLSCDKPLGAVEFDHVVALGLGGANTPDNWAALCPVCHRKKTIADLRCIAKAKRQRRFHETGRSRAPSGAHRLGGGKGFERQLRRHLNGAVTGRCHCPRCSGVLDKGGGDA